MSPAEQRSPSRDEIVIRRFQTGDAGAFRRLNEEWISRYFRMEAKDEQILADPERTILDAGGQILFATVDGRCIGCCALIRIADNEFEVAKMAVEPAHQGAGIGRMLLRAGIDEGRRAGARRLYLETSHILVPAIRLYESAGFKHMDANRITPSPYARGDVYMEMILV